MGQECSLHHGESLVRLLARKLVDKDYSGEKTGMSNHQVNVFSSIQFKVIVVTVATITMIFGCFSVVDHFLKHSRVQDELIQATDIAARRLAENQKIPVWDLNPELARALLLVEMQVADVYALAVYEYTKEGETVFRHTA